MKEYWYRLQLRIDALSLRERVMAFAIAALTLITLINVLVLDPLLSRQKQLSDQAMQNEQQIAALQAEIQRLVTSHGVDPDAGNRTKLQELKQQSGRIRGELLGVQKGLVSPEKMTTVLDDILKKNRSLQLVSLKTLPVSLLTSPASSGDAPGVATPAPAKEKEDAKALGEAVYQHGVEIVVEGSYADVTAYLAQLESMPWQVFWGGAKLTADSYPKVKVTLTLYTLSLDKTWLNI